MSLIVDEHREYLSDAARISAFGRAMAEVVRPGDVVLDLGCGTGILGLLACRAGAARVYAVEEGGMITVARELARTNGVADRVRFVYGHSQHVTLPEPVDVVVADQIGRFGIGAGVIEDFADARRRLLKPDGRLLPSHLELRVAPVEAPEVSGWVEFWESAPAGFDFRPVRDFAANTGYPVRLEPAQLLAGPPGAAVLGLGDDAARRVVIDADFEVARAGVLHGIGGWFSARLSPGVVLTNEPGAADRIGRRNVVFPVDRPVPVAPGDRVHVSMRLLPADAVVSWQVEVVPEGRPEAAIRFAHTTLKGMLIPREDLTHTDPAFVPALTARGRARQTVLELTDGRRPLGEIERALYERHRDLFVSPDQAAAFVAEVITRYAE